MHHNVMVNFEDGLLAVSILRERIHHNIMVNSEALSLAASTSRERIHHNDMVNSEDGLLAASALRCQSHHYNNLKILRNSLVAQSVLIYQFLKFLHRTTILFLADDPAEHYPV